MIPKEIKEFLKKAISKTKAKKSKLVLSTLVLDDGLGDAGMLSFLYERIRKISGLDIQVIIFSPRDESIFKTKMCELFDNDKNLRIEFAESNFKANFYQRYFSGDDYAIFYPYTFPFPPAEFTTFNYLAIKEMGEQKAGCYKTSLSCGGIGFGIPQWEPEKRDISCPPDWLISCKSYLAKNTKQLWQEDIQPRVKRIISLGQEVGIKRILFILPKKMHFCNSNMLDDQNIEVVLTEPLSKNDLRFCLDNTREAVFSGGEGLFVEAMGTHGPATSILCPRYSFQCFELLQTLISLAPKIEKEFTKEEFTKYRFFFTTQHFLYYDGESFCNILDGIKQYSLKAEKLYTNDALPAIWLPLYINTDIKEIEIPSMYANKKEAYSEALKILKRANEIWKGYNWFSVFDEF